MGGNLDNPVAKQGKSEQYHQQEQSFYDRACETHMPEVVVETAVVRNFRVWDGGMGLDY